MLFLLYKSFGRKSPSISYNNRQPLRLFVCDEGRRKRPLRTLPHSSGWASVPSKRFGLTLQTTGPVLMPSRFFSIQDIACATDLFARSSPSTTLANRH